MHTLKLTRSHKVGNSYRYLSLIYCRRGFAHPPRSVQYYGKFPTSTLISGLTVLLHRHNAITRSIRLDEIYPRRDGPKQEFFLLLLVFFSFCCETRETRPRGAVQLAPKKRRKPRTSGCCWLRPWTRAASWRRRSAAFPGSSARPRWQTRRHCS